VILECHALLRRLDRHRHLDLPSQIERKIEIGGAGGPRSVSRWETHTGDMGRHVLPLLITLLAVAAAGSQEVYDGDYDSNGNRDGYGVYTWPDGAVYRGTWQANSRHGRGSFRWPSGDHYDGEWANDTQDGEAVFVWADGRTFTGGFKAGSIEGFGRFVRPDGLVYEGDYVSTKREGHGCLLEADSSSYCGEFGHRGKMHGYGVKVWPAGLMESRRTDEGLWVRDSLHDSSPEAVQRARAEAAVAAAKLTEPGSFPLSIAGRMSEGGDGAAGGTAKAAGGKLPPPDFTLGKIPRATGEGDTVGSMIAAGDGAAGGRYGEL